MSQLSSIPGQQDDFEYKGVIYPTGYQVSTVIYAHTLPDHCFTIEKYSGNHFDEYMECYRVDGQKTGIGTLYKGGERILQCSFCYNIIQGWGTLYKNGVPSVQVLWKDNEVIRTILLSNIDYSQWMDERTKDGSLVYTGDYDLSTYNRDGYGVVYSNNEMSLFGKFANNDLVHICKTFHGHQMTEYNEYNATVYIGTFENNLETHFPRKGQGKEYDLQRIVYEGTFHNNQRHGYGISYHENGVIAFKGYWKEGKPYEGIHLPYSKIMNNVSMDGIFEGTCESFPCIEMYASVVTFLHIADHACNETSFSSFILTELPHLREIVIGKNACCHVRFFAVTGLPNLESIRIGRDSFTLCDHLDNAPNRNRNEERIIRENRNCYITNCSHLQQIIIDVGCFSDYVHFILESGLLYLILM